jgi:hypothetical protein
MIKMTSVHYARGHSVDCSKYIRVFNAIFTIADISLSLAVPWNRSLVGRNQELPYPRLVIRVGDINHMMEK